jgi:hypothetical protein
VLLLPKRRPCTTATSTRGLANPRCFLSRELCSVLRNDVDLIEADGEATEVVVADDAQSKSIDEGQTLQKQATSESDDKEISSAASVSEQYTGSDNTRQTTLPQVNGHSYVDSMPPRYEGIEYNVVQSPSQGGKIVDTDGRTKRPTTSEPEALQNRSKLRRKLIETISKLKEKRDNILGLRLKLNELRTSLRQERENLSARDAQLIQRMRVMFLGNEISTLSPLLEDFEHLQEIRDSLQPREYDYDRLEDQVNREEYELGELESKLYPISASAQISTLADEELIMFDGRFDDTESSLSTHSDSAENSSKVNEYLSRKGDMHVLEERLNELRMERAQLVEEELVRAQVGRALDEYSQAFLLNFDIRHDELQRELAHTKEDVARLRMALLEKEDFIISPDQFDDTRRDMSGKDSLVAIMPNPALSTDEILNPEEADSEEQEPLLLTGAEEPNPVFSESALQDSKSVINKASYINLWLLHRLRISLPEVRRFRSTLELKDLNLDQTQIKDMVLKWWFNDGSAAAFALARKVGVESLNPSVLTTQGLPAPRGTRSESFASALQEAVLQARNHKGPVPRHSDDVSPVQPSTTLFTRGSPSMFQF